MKFHFLTAAASALLSAHALAQAPASDSAPAMKMMNFTDILSKGGVMVIPLVVLSLVTVLLILLYLITIRRNTVVSDRFMNAAEAMIRKRDYLGLIAYCHRHNESIARVTHKTLDFLTKYPRAAFSSVREVAEAEGSRQASSLTSRISYLADIGAIAPMIGLLGTVFGMIKAFVEIAGNGGEEVRQMELASGVSEALVATAAGLAIAIPALVFYAIFRSRVQKYISELEAAATHIIALLHAEEDSQPLPTAHHPQNRPRDEYPSPLPRQMHDRDLHGI